MPEESHLGGWLVQLAPVSVPGGLYLQSIPRRTWLGPSEARGWLLGSVVVDIPSETIRCPSDLYAGARP